MSGGNLIEWRPRDVLAVEFVALGAGGEEADESVRELAEPVVVAFAARAEHAVGAAGAG